MTTTEGEMTAEETILSLLQHSENKAMPAEEVIRKVSREFSQGQARRALWRLMERRQVDMGAALELKLVRSQ